MLVFRVRKEPFDWIAAGKKSVELRRGGAKQGESATFVRGRKQPVKARIVGRQEGKLEDLISSATFQRAVPTGVNADEAMQYLKRLYPSIYGMFAAYEIEIPEEERCLECMFS